MTNQILALRDHLVEQKVTVVVMESTSNYWRPFYYLLEEDFAVVLVNARDARNVPGRKTDVSDAAWLADLGAHGLVRASFVPPSQIRELRDLTRARTHITQERTREVQRLEKLLEDACIKLSSVATDIMGVSGRLMLQALIDQQCAADPVVVADLAKRRMRSKIPELTEALTGHFTAHHAFMTRMFLDRIDAQSKDIAVLSKRIENLMEPFLPVQDLLESIPGINQIVAEVFIAETGGDMTQFPTPEQLASWAGVSPGAHESAGKVKSSKTRPGNRYLKGALGIAALTALRIDDPHLLLGEIPPARPDPRADEGSRRGRTRHAHRRLAHAPRRRALPRPRRRLLHPPRAHQSQSPGHQTTRSPRLPGHHRTPTASQLTPIQQPARQYHPPWRITLSPTSTVTSRGHPIFASDAGLPIRSKLSSPAEWTGQEHSATRTLGHPADATRAS